MKKRILALLLAGCVAFSGLPMDVYANEGTATEGEEREVYTTYYEDGTESPVTFARDEYSRQIYYANGTSLIFKDGKMYEDLAPLGEFDSEVDKHIYTNPYKNGNSYDDEEENDIDLTYMYVETDGMDNTIYGDSYITVINTVLRGVYVNHVTNATVYLENSDVTNQYIENAEGNVNYTVKNQKDLGNGIEVMETGLSTDGGLIKGSLNITLDNVGDGNGSIHTSGTVLGDTTISINNCRLYDIEPAHNTGSESKKGNVSLVVNNSELESISIASWGHHGSAAAINGDIDVTVKNSKIELGIYRYATNEQGYSSNAVTNTVTGNAAVCVENSIIRDIIDRGGYSNSDSISENATLSLKNVEVETLVSNSVNIDGTVQYGGMLVNDLKLNENVTLISGLPEDRGSISIRNQLSGIGTIKANVKDVNQYISFKSENPIAKDTKITIEPVHLEESGYVPYIKNEKLGGSIEIRFDRNTEPTSYLAYFTCANYELNEFVGIDFNEITVLNYCEEHNYKLAKKGGEGNLIYHASVYDKAADCTHKGVETYYCKNCGKFKYEETKELGHAYEVEKVVNPTATEKGYTVYKCTRCGDSYNDNYIDAVPSMKILFEGNGKTSGSMNVIDAVPGTNVTLTANGYKKTGYIFKGWNTKADGTGTAYADGEQIINLTTKGEATLTLYAQWKPISYTIILNGNGATNITTVEGVLEYDEYITITGKDVLERPGYTFTGWNTKADGTGTAYEDGVPLKNLTTENGAVITLYAQWKKDGYSLTEADVVLPIADFIYNGTAIIPTVKVSYNGTDLVAGKDYKIEFANNTNAGTATVTVTGMGDYTGTVTRTFTINKAHIDSEKVSLSKTSYTYNGKTQKPKVTVVVNGRTLTANDYTVAYKNNKNIGTATVTITGKGNYTGVVVKNFTINVKKGTTVTVNKNKYTVTGDSAVTFTKTTSTGKTLEIPKTVKYGGKNFKVTAIASKALKGNKNVTKVTIGANVTSIGASAFAGCTKLTTVTVGSKVKTIGTSAFEGCKKLSKVTLGSAVSKIDAKAFKNCTALKSITIPSKVTTYGKQAFYGCKNLKAITFKSKMIKAAGKDAFKNIYAKATIKVPKSSYKQYKEMLKATGAGKKIKIVKVK